MGEERSFGDPRWSCGFIYSAGNFAIFRAFKSRPRPRARKPPTLCCSPFTPESSKSILTKMTIFSSYLALLNADHRLRRDQHLLKKGIQHKLFFIDLLCKTAVAYVFLRKRPSVTNYRTFNKKTTQVEQNSLTQPTSTKSN